MSGWTDVEAPNAPDGLADTGDGDNRFTRVDPVTGDTPGDEGAQDYVPPKYLDEDAPLAVVVVEMKKKKVLLSSGSHTIRDGSISQIVGSTDDPTRTVRIKIIGIDAQDYSDYCIIGPERENLDYGYRLDHREPEEFTTQDDIFAKAVGGDITVHWAIFKAV